MKISHSFAAIIWVTSTAWADRGALGQKGGTPRGAGFLQQGVLQLTAESLQTGDTFKQLQDNMDQNSETVTEARQSDAEVVKLSEGADKSFDTFWAGIAPGKSKTKSEGISAVLSMLAEDLDTEMAAARADDADTATPSVQSGTHNVNTSVKGEDDNPQYPRLQESSRSNEGGSVTPVTNAGKVWWKAESDVPKFLQYTFAITWVTMLASLPIILPFLDHRQVTKTQIILAVTTTLVLFGGFYLFTNVVLFQSSHFEKVRSLTMVECIYFMAQTVTTIGYGDIGPAKIRGQLFVGFYVIFSLFVIAMVIEDFTEHMVKVAKQAKKKLHEAFLRVEASGDHLKTVDSLITPPKPSVEPLLTAFLVFVLIDICFIVFFSCWPGEQKTVFQATYMSLITLGSIGFGFFTPLTEAGMIFGAFSMVLGCATLVVVIGEFVALMYQLNEYERFNKAEAKMAAMLTLKGMLKGSENVTQLQFLQFVLVQSKKVEQDEMDDILRVFENLGPQDGVLDLMTVQQATTPRQIIVR